MPPERTDNHPPECAYCGDEYNMETGDEPTKYCNQCAHFLAETEGPRCEMGKLLVDLELNAERSPWFKQQGPLGWLASLEREVAELRAEVEAGRLLRAGDELGDVLWNLVSLALSLEQAGVPWDLEAVCAYARDKLRRRKPWIFDGRAIDFDADGEHELFVARKAEVG